MIQGVAIGEAARQSGVKAPTIRYYEQIGLLLAPSRSEGNRRHFDDGDLRRLTFIRHARELGFEIDAIRTLLTLQDDPSQPCATADSIAKARLADVEQRIRSLTALRKGPPCPFPRPIPGERFAAQPLARRLRSPLHAIDQGAFEPLWKP